MVRIQEIAGLAEAVEGARNAQPYTARVCSLPMDFTSGPPWLGAANSKFRVVNARRQIEDLVGFGLAIHEPE